MDNGDITVRVSVRLHGRLIRDFRAYAMLDGHDIQQQVELAIDEWIFIHSSGNSVPEDVRGVRLPISRISRKAVALHAKRLGISPRSLIVEAIKENVGFHRERETAAGGASESAPLASSAGASAGASAVPSAGATATCLRCGNIWKPRGGIAPSRCTKCQSTRWNEEREAGADRNVTCCQCGNTWCPRGESEPSRCPKCQSTEWNDPWKCGRCGKWRPERVRAGAYCLHHVPAAVAPELPVSASEPVSPDGNAFPALKDGAFRQMEVDVPTRK